MRQQITFFRNKNVNFLSIIVPKLHPHKVFSCDYLYSEGQVAQELYFVTNGSFSLYMDLSAVIPDLPSIIDPESEAFNVPYIIYTMESFFGDHDFLHAPHEMSGTKKKGQQVQTKKYLRDSTAVADAGICELM